MHISYSEHALKRMKQRGITRIEAEFILLHTSQRKRLGEERREAVGIAHNREICIIFTEKENYIKVITLF